MNHQTKTSRSLSAETPVHRPRYGQVCLVAAVASYLAFGATSAFAVLANSPLFVATPVKPNIFFMADDSGSMDFAVVTPDVGEGYFRAGSCLYMYVHPTPGLPAAATSPARNQYEDGTLTVPSEEALQSNAAYSAPYGGVWRAWNSDYNALYYNPRVRYTPWSGLDVDGNPYTNASPTAARYNPYRPTHGTINLTAPTSYRTVYCVGAVTTVNVNNFYPAQYYVWTDSDNDGQVDAADAHTQVKIQSGVNSYTGSMERTDCAARTTCTYDEEIQNFANWFSYYRKRDLAAKNAISKTVSGMLDRVGFATLWNNSGTSRIRIAEMNASTSAGNKRALLDAVFSTRPNNSTPLRTALDRVGRYYECTSGNVFGVASPANCPLLSAAEGGNCQQNFTILMTDGYYNDSFNFAGSSDNKDGDGSSAFDTNEFGPYGDSYNNTLADVAMHYYERDLSSSLNNDVRAIPGIDEARHQHMNTYTVAFGVSGTLAAGPANRTSPFTWPNPALSDSRKIDDLRHAAFNGRGMFLSASNPTQLSTALNDAITDISGLTGSAASVAVNVRSLTVGARIYQVRFTSGQWSGDVRSLPLNTNGTIGNTEWSAAARLTDLIGADGSGHSARRILTRNDATGSSVLFQWNQLSPAQQTLLHTNPTTGVNDSDGQNRLNYLRGHSYYESTDTPNGNRFRPRLGQYLGDIVHSAAVYVGTPPPFPDSIEPTATGAQAYSAFVSAQASRTPMLYVGANDGMLHGFEVLNSSLGGSEKIAYVPSAVYPNLARLTDPAYVHRYYVDASPTSGSAYYGNAWHTLVISGLGAGGKGYFGLDVTNPANFSTAAPGDVAKWEFTNATDADMGFSVGQATITRMNNGRWAAIFPNGYNNSGSGRAVLYILFLDGAADGVITSTDFVKLDTRQGSPSNQNALASPATLDINNDFMPDYIYAGDVQGNMWKFDVSSTDPNNWRIAYGTPGSPQPVFQARDSSGDVQPITVRPQVGFHPAGETGYMIYFGTGRYLEDGDRFPSTAVTQSFYGIWDKNTNGTTIPVTRADLLAQTIASATTRAGIAVRTVSDLPINWSPGGHLGWRTDLPATGELSVSNPIWLDSRRANYPRIIFTTLIPRVLPCDYGGDSWLMELNPVNGGKVGITVFDVDENGVFNEDDLAGGDMVSGYNPNLGIMPEPVVLDDNISTPAIKLKIATGTSGAVKAVKNKDDCNPSVDPGCEPPDPTPARKSWRQLK